MAKEIVVFVHRALNLKLDDAAWKAAQPKLSPFKQVRIQVAAGDDKKKEADLQGFGDFMVDTYPTDQWHLDLDLGNDAHWVFYAEDPKAVVKYFEEQTPEFGLKIEKVTIGLLSPEQFEKVKKRLDEDM